MRRKGTCRDSRFQFGTGFVVVTHCFVALLRIAEIGLRSGHGEQACPDACLFHKFQMRGDIPVGQREGFFQRCTVPVEQRLKFRQYVVAMYIDGLLRRYLKESEHKR